MNFYTFQELLDNKLVDELDGDGHTSIKDGLQIKFQEEEFVTEFFVDEDGVNVEDSNGEGEVIDIVQINDDVFQVYKIEEIVK